MIADCGEGMAHLYDLRKRGIDISRRLEALGRKRSKLELYRFNLSQIPMFPNERRQRRHKSHGAADPG